MRSPSTSSRRSAASTASILSIIEAISARPVTLKVWAAASRKNVQGVVKEHNDKPSVHQAAAFANQVIDAIEAKFPADFELCGMKQAVLDKAIGEIGAAIEVAFGKLALEPVKG